MKRNIFKRQTYEDKFDRKFAAFMINHSGTAKVKRMNRKLARARLKEEVRRVK